jgi:hypothetical protein
MATNATETAVDDSKQVTDEDLRKLKEDSEVETLEGADEAQDTDETEEESKETGEEDGKTDDQAEEEEEQSEDSFVKEFINIKGETLEDYARNLEEAYKQSTGEAIRLKGELDKAPKDTEIGETSDAEVDLTDPVSLFMKQKMDEEITTAYNDFSKSFPQVQDATEYAKFTNEVATLSQTILQSQKRLASPKELYSKAAVILGWEPDATVDNKDKLNIALKGSASISKTTSATKPKSTSKITDAQVTIAKQMGGWTDGKSDAEIRKELEIVT